LKRSKEILVGLVVLIALALLFWGVNFLKGKDVLYKNRIAYAVYHEVNGLKKTNPVSINGLNVGQVDDIYFIPDGSYRIAVVMLISNEIAIPENSIARIITSDLMGSKEVQIVLGDSRRYVESGDTLVSDIEASLKEEVNKQVQPIKRKAEDLLLSIDSVVTVVHYIFNRATQENLAKSFESIKVAFDNLENVTYNIDTLVDAQKTRMGRILSNIESITFNLKQNKDNLNNIIANFSTLSDTLAKAKISETLLSTNEAMNQVSTIVERINEGEGTLGMLVNDDSLYIQLEKSASELNLLIEDIRTNPKKYVKFSIW